MGNGFVFGGSVLAATIAGVLALFAPCCISVMLPTYLASSIHNRRSQFAMTFLYGAGVATVVLPIALGAIFMRRLIFGQHTIVFSIAGALLIALGCYTLAGGGLHLPMPTGRRTGRAGPFGVYSMGVVSGLATSCCAPVLAGVVALSGLASSFVAAMSLGGAYVFGMVAPLFVMALVWQRAEPKLAPLFRPRSINVRIGPFQHQVSAMNLASGLMLVSMGFWTLWMAAHGVSMVSATGWEGTLTAKLEHAGHDITSGLSGVPGWIVGSVIVIAVVLFARRATRELGWRLRPARSRSNPVTDANSADFEIVNAPTPNNNVAATKESPVEHAK